MYVDISEIFYILEALVLKVFLYKSTTRYICYVHNYSYTTIFHRLKVMFQCPKIVRRAYYNHVLLSRIRFIENNEEQSKTVR